MGSLRFPATRRASGWPSAFRRRTITFAVAVPRARPRGGSLQAAEAGAVPQARHPGARPASRGAGAVAQGAPRPVASHRAEAPSPNQVRVTIACAERSLDRSCIRERSGRSSPLLRSALLTRFGPGIRRPPSPSFGLIARGWAMTCRPGAGAAGGRWARSASSCSPRHRPTSRWCSTSGAPHRWRGTSVMKRSRLERSRHLSASRGRSTTRHSTLSAVARQGCRIAFSLN